MTQTCPMCGHTFEWEDDFGGGGPSHCPACGTALSSSRSSRGAVDRAVALRKVQAPAVALMAVGGLTVLSGFANVAIAVASLVIERPNAAPEDAVIGAVAYTVGAITSFALAALIIAGGLKMYRLQAWGLALAASIVSALPCAVCCLIGLPIGIWSIVVLNDPEVKEAFES